MPRPRSPRKGSKSFYPRRRASHFNGRIQQWPEVTEGPQLLGFAGYKAGMTHLYQVEDRAKVPEFGQEVKIAATVIEAPPILICAVRSYKETYDGYKVITEAWMAQPPKDLIKAGKFKKTPDASKEMEKLVSVKDKAKEIRILAATQPKLASLEKNVSDLIEIKVGGGNIDQQIEYAKGLLGKTISASQVFKPGESIDLAGVTKGKGFQGPVKRFGIRIQQNKSRKTIRGVASIAPVSPRTIHPHVARAGQMGSHHRVDFNKRILLLGSDGARVSPTGGFNRYGLVKSDYIVIKGSVQGTPKRLIRMRKAIRGTIYPKVAPQVTYINTEWGKEKSQ
ncbi:50S ribosomal protein L3 [Candidatus Bathyarchaeota archaeon RBG_13_52_12]|nr:50S ribosomal protein L3P [uncultured archaeon]OGD59957.1 MAG: 50S ribosomal protein L3 [Candidatus Bathyarchaeota archaeon RBG_13_52_12]